MGQHTIVVRSDTIDAKQCFAMHPDAIVISPGPKTPAEAGCSVDVIQQADHRLPILGVCLGHQAIGVAFGGKIAKCPPMHGMASSIEHDGSGVFRDCPSPMKVGRYHSLCVDHADLPPELAVDAVCSTDGVIMGIHHRSRPVFGVQFHPESVLSDFGKNVLRSFIQITDRKNISNTQAVTS